MQNRPPLFSTGHCLDLEWEHFPLLPQDSCWCMDCFKSSLRLWLNCAGFFLGGGGFCCVVCSYQVQNVPIAYFIHCSPLHPTPSCNNQLQKRSKLGLPLTRKLGKAKHLPTISSFPNPSSPECVFPLSLRVMCPTEPGCQPES